MYIASGININFGTVIVNTLPMQTIDTNFHNFIGVLVLSKIVLQEIMMMTDA